MTRALLLSMVLFGCGCIPCLGPDACVTTNTETLSCDVRRPDGGVASGVIATCTGTADAGAMTDTSGRFTINLSVTRGGIAGYSDDCGTFDFREGDTALTARDGGLHSRQLNGAEGSSGCLVVVE